MIRRIKNTIIIIRKREILVRKMINSSKKETESDTIANYIISEALFEFVRSKFYFFNELMFNLEHENKI